MCSLAAQLSNPSHNHHRHRRASPRDEKQSCNRGRVGIQMAELCLFPRAILDSYPLSGPAPSPFDRRCTLRLFSTCQKLHALRHCSPKASHSHWINAASDSQACCSSRLTCVHTGGRLVLFLIGMQDSCEHASTCRRPVCQYKMSTVFPETAMLVQWRTSKLASR